MDKNRLAKGYIKYADRSRWLAKEMHGTSSEATQYLGAAPEWTTNDDD